LGQPGAGTEYALGIVQCTSWNTNNPRNIFIYIYNIIYNVYNIQYIIIYIYMIIEFQYIIIFPLTWHAWVIRGETQACHTFEV
jgi:hypothetical protein